MFSSESKRLLTGVFFKKRKQLAMFLVKNTHHPKLMRKVLLVLGGFLNWRNNAMDKLAHIEGMIALTYDGYRVEVAMLLSLLQYFAA